VGIGMMFFVALLICLGILAVAVLVFRHQRMLQEKKAAYQKCSKERVFHHRRYTTLQVDLDRLRVSYNNRIRELMLMNTEMEKLKGEIREILEILRDESKSVDQEMEQDLSRIIERRKGMIENLWKEINGKKMLWMDRVKQARTDRKSQNGLIEKKDREFQLMAQFNDELVKLKHEYDELARSSILSIGKKQ
jgi:hypothetical protein